MMEQVAEARGLLDVQIRQAHTDWEHRPDSLEYRLVRLVVPVPKTNIYDWLAAQTLPDQVLWKGKRAGWRMAGVGVADRVSGGAVEDAERVLARCRKYLSANSDVRYYGGFAFQPDATDDEGWFRFGASRFVLPRFELTGEKLTCNLLFRADHPVEVESVRAELDALVFPAATAAPVLPPIVARRDLPDQQGWEGNVLTALDMIEHDVIEKIVLARRADYAFAESTSAAKIMAKLSRVTRNCFHFLFQPEPQVAFMGTTPERLFKREDRQFESEVIAGTRPRGEDPEADAAFSAALLESEKDQLEHDIVRRAMRQKLHLLCDDLQVEEEAGLLVLERKQHLVSRIEGRLAPGNGDVELLSSLHPTPAVGGYPRENALREIRRLEPFCRGWYASPVGWVSGNASEFAVAIRSGLVQGNKVSVYSGAGIVRGSDPAEEWQEIESKIADFVKVTQ